DDPDRRGRGVDLSRAGGGRGASRRRRPEGGRPSRSGGAARSPSRRRRQAERDRGGSARQRPARPPPAGRRQPPLWRPCPTPHLRGPRRPPRGLRLGGAPDRGRPERPAAGRCGLAPRGGPTRGVSNRRRLPGRRRRDARPDGRRRRGRGGV
ncbi:MAG: hypothetical protein AVDCRST_MAG59-930, partial [uncultured Thermomicrobiales bacterium]